MTSFNFLEIQSVQEPVIVVFLVIILQRALKLPGVLFIIKKNSVILKLFELESLIWLGPKPHEFIDNCWDTVHQWRQALIQVYY